MRTNDLWFSNTPKQLPGPEPETAFERGVTTQAELGLKAAEVHAKAIEKQAFPARTGAWIRIGQLILITAVILFFVIGGIGSIQAIASFMASNVVLSAVVIFVLFLIIMIWLRRR